MSRAFFSLLLALGCTAGEAASTLDFDKTFHDKGEPPQIHFQARYVLNGATHGVEVWRDSDQRLKRHTDDAIETYLFKPAKELEWQMTVLDLKRHIRTDIGRTNLARVGHFTDWFAMAHALAHPVGHYQLEATSAPALAEPPLASCTWYALTRDGVPSKLCWSHALHLPLVISGRDDAVAWRVTAVDLTTVDAKTFAINDAGYVRNDANSDISGD